jgi:quercetin dioxygenase-like cupin family protein
MSLESARDRVEPDRLDPEWFHLFSLSQLAKSLRARREYSEQGRTAMILVKSEHLSVVLEVAAEGAEVAEHSVQGPAVVHVLDGELAISSLDETRIAHGGELVAIPHGRPRSIAVRGDACFLWTISVDRPNA